MRAFGPPDASLGEAPDPDQTIALVRLFGVSDSLIAMNHFHAPVPGVRWLIMALYWAGQYGIARSVARR